MSINLITWNCQSVKPKIIELTEFLTLNIHIALLCETWLQPRISFSIPGYECYRADRIHRTLLHSF